MTYQVHLTDEDVAQAGGPFDRLIDAVVGRVFSQMNSRLVYAEPVTMGERTVIPVARMRYTFGLGGGTGGRRDETGSGGGGGGIANAQPIGYIEVTPDGTRFMPIADRSGLAMVGAIIGGLAMLTILRRLLPIGKARKA